MRRRSGSGKKQFQGEFGIPTTPSVNTLFYGDNLDILREYIADESVDLVYLDPPFNSNATYNVLFKAPSGEQSQAQIEAFEDSWHWNASAEEAFDQVITYRQHEKNHAKDNNDLDAIRGHHASQTALRQAHGEKFARPPRHVRAGQ